MLEIREESADLRVILYDGFHPAERLKYGDTGTKSGFAGRLSSLTGKLCLKERFARTSIAFVGSTDLSPANKTGVGGDFEECGETLKDFLECPEDRLWSGSRAGASARKSLCADGQSIELIADACGVIGAPCGWWTVGGEEGIERIADGVGFLCLGVTMLDHECKTLKDVLDKVGGSVGEIRRCIPFCHDAFEGSRIFEGFSGEEE